MIVISGALVAVALILLVVGLTVTTLNLIYASIAVSAVSLGFLLVGIVQRRGELPAPELAAVVPAVDGGAPFDQLAPTGAADGVLAVPPFGAARRTDLVVGTDGGEPAVGTSPARSPGASVPAPQDNTLAPQDSVLVVVGRPRYHLAGCRYLTGKSADAVPVADARGDGFTACGVCKPDAGRTEAVATVPAQAPAVSVPAPVRSGGPAVPAVAGPVRPAAKKAAAATTARALAKAVGTPQVDAGLAELPPEQRAPVTGQQLDNVVVFADRGKFHANDCRYVRGAVGTTVLGRAAATSQGFVACGTCKP